MSVRTASLTSFLRECSLEIKDLACSRVALPCADATNGTASPELK